MKSPYCSVKGCDRWRMTNMKFCMSHLQVKSKEKRAESQPTSKPRPLKKVSVKQADINTKLHEVYEAMDNEARFLNGGTLVCEAYPGGDFFLLDHSHTISRDRCKKLGHPEWITEVWNIEHCSRKAHEEWDHYKPEFCKHANFDRRMSILRLYDPHDYERRMEIWAKANKPKETL